MAREIIIAPVDIAETQEQTEKKHKWSTLDVPEAIRIQRDPCRVAARDLIEIIEQRGSSEVA